MVGGPRRPPSSIHKPADRPAPHSPSTRAGTKLLPGSLPGWQRFLPDSSGEDTQPVLRVPEKAWVFFFPPGTLPLGSFRSTVLSVARVLVIA